MHSVAIGAEYSERYDGEELAYSFHAAGGRMHRQWQGLSTLMSSALKPPFTTNGRPPGGKFVLHAKTLPGIPMTGNARRPHQTHRDAHRAVRSSAPMSTRAIAATNQKPAPHLHLWPEARRLRNDQPRVPPPLGNRARHQSHEDRWAPRPSRRRLQGRC